MLSDVIKKYGGEKMDPLDVYKDIFRIGEGFIQKEYEDSGSFKANPIAYYKNGNEDHGHFRIMFEDKFEEIYQNELVNADFCVMNGLTYFGAKYTSDRASKMCAMIFDIDGVTDNGLNNFFYAAFNKDFDYYPLPNYVALSGHGIHLYSIFDEPVMKVNEDITDYNENVKDDIENYSEEKKKVIMPEMYPVGLAKGTYIICHNELGIYMIDQHAAKERINYEGYLKAFGNPLKGSIKMLIPLTLEFPSNEFIIIKQNIDVLKDMHFDIEESGINSFTIKEHPTWIKEGYEVESIKKVLEVLISEEKHFSIEKFREKAAIMLSCKMAIKANMNISMEEMEALINDLRKCDNPYTCPHGRPTTIFYSNYELEKMFKRAM